MRSLDLAVLVALAAEVSEVEVPKLLELLDTAEVTALLADARPPLPPHEAAALLLVGLIAVSPLPAGNRRLGILAALQLLAVNGLEAELDPPATRALLSRVAGGGEDAAGVAAWLDGRVTACDPLEDDLRRLLSADAWRAIALARQRASRHRRRQATPSDLLMGLFREGTGPAAMALGADGRAMEAVTRPARPPVPERCPRSSPPPARSSSSPSAPRPGWVTRRSTEATWSSASSTAVMTTSCPTASTPARSAAGSSSRPDPAHLPMRKIWSDASSAWSPACGPRTRRRRPSWKRWSTSRASGSTG